MTITIEKNIPLPSRQAKRTIYPFALMEVGDSCFIQGKACTQLGGSITLHRKNGKKFACRTVEGGARVWRTK